MSLTPLTFHKIAHRCLGKKIPFIPNLLMFLNTFLYGCEIAPSVSFGKKSGLAHRGLGVLIVGGTKIGNNCTIGINTVIARKHPYKDVAEIGNNVYIGPNVSIIGPVVIEDNVIIGANSVVTKSIPANSIVAGNPAKKIGLFSDLDYDIFSNPRHKEGKAPFLS